MINSGSSSLALDSRAPVNSRRRVFRVNPATLILLWLMLVGGVLMLPTLPLIFAALMFVLIAFATAFEPLRKILFRSRWLMFSLLILFGWTTPGTPIPGLGGASEEGARQAIEQMSRLLISMASVALLLRWLDSAQLLAGVRTLAWPLILLGVDRDRLSVRLALTLKRIEQGSPGTSSVFSSLRDEMVDPTGLLADTKIDMPTSPWGPTDMLLIIFGTLVLGTVWVLG